MSAPPAFQPPGGARELFSCRVLVIDDSPQERHLVGTYLERAGIRNVFYAAGGAEGLEMADRHQPDLVILDVMMDGMDGFELCRRLRLSERHRHLAILVQTASETAEDRIAVFRSGATDLIIKPILGAELVARVRTHLENRLLIQELEDFRTSMTADLDLARGMQAALMPKADAAGRLAAAAGFRAETHFQPSAILGGDLWTLQALDETRIGVGMVDFSGHGVAAALNVFRLHSLATRIPLSHRLRPSAYLRELNRYLVPQLPRHQFATMVYAVIDSRSETMTYAGAGAPAPMLVTGDRVHELDTAGLPLGISADAAYRDHRIAFPEGASLLLYSDALVETPDRTGETLDPARLKAMVASCHREKGLSLAALLALFGQDRAPPEDDLTLLWLHRTEKPGLNLSGHRE